MNKIRLNRIQIYRFTSLEGFPGISHFISTRNPDEKMAFNICMWSAAEIQTVIENRKLLANELQIPLSAFVFQQQMHTSKVTHVGVHERGSGVHESHSALEDNDGMVTNEKGVCIVVIGGDCVPLLFFDPVKEVVGAAHSGWRGTAQRIAEKTVQAMTETHGCNPADILVGIGPSISQKNYEVDEMVLEAFKKSYSKVNEFFNPGLSTGKYYLDLWKANQIQLIDAGILPHNIEIAGICTYDNTDFFSARRGDSGRFGCGIMLT